MMKRETLVRIYKGIRELQKTVVSAVTAAKTSGVSVTRDGNTLSAGGGTPPPDNLTIEIRSGKLQVKDAHLAQANHRLTGRWTYPWSGVWFDFVRLTDPGWAGRTDYPGYY
ncbi:MAG: hypothetical protein WC485_03615 [Opitutaceae bacterium]